MKKTITETLIMKDLTNVSFGFNDDGSFEIWRNEDGTHLNLTKAEAGSLQRFIFSRFQYQKHK